MKLEMELLTDPGEMEKDLPAQSQLLKSSSDDSVFLRMEWQGAWWKQYGRKRQLQTIRVREGDRLIGYGSFMTTGLGRLFRSKKLEFVGAGHSDQLGIVAENDRGDVVRAILDLLIEDSNWDIGEFRDIRENGPTARYVLDKFPQAEVSKENSPYIPVRSSFQEYLSTLSQNSRHNIVRTVQKNMVEFGAKFVRIDDPDIVPSALEKFFHLNEMRWSDKGERSVLTAEMRDFLRDAVLRLAVPGISVIHALDIGEKTIAMCLGFEYNGRYLYYLSGLDPAYMKQSPGRCIISKIIEEAHARKLKEVDLLRGDEEYKYHLGAKDRNNIVVKIRMPSLNARIVDNVS